MTDPEPTTPHPAHTGHEYGGAYARAAALAAGDPDWMNATGGRTPRPILAALKIMRDALGRAGYKTSDRDSFDRRAQELLEGRIPPVPENEAQATGLRALNTAGAALSDAGHSFAVRAPSEPGEFVIEIDGVDVAVKIEVL